MHSMATVDLKRDILIETCSKYSEKLKKFDPELFIMTAAGKSESEKFIITDSSPRNVLNTRELINYAAQFVGKDCPIIAIANKQDLQKSDGRMNPKRVEEILRVKTYGLTAINPTERTKLMDIIRKELNQISVRRGLKKVAL